MCVGGGVVNHGLVLVGHGDVLLHQLPAGRLLAGLGGGGGGVAVEMVGIGEFISVDVSAPIMIKHDVIDVVYAVVARVAFGQGITESDVVALDIGISKIYLT